MEASNMLDVLHYFMEEDLVRFGTGEHMEAASSVRSTIYRTMYKRDYSYAVSSSSGSGSSRMTYADGSPVDFSEDGLSDITPFDPLDTAKSSKPFIPPTNFNPDAELPFGKNLDAPLG
jgi:hypothetical protein